MTFEQRLPQFAFEVADLDADPGLGDPQLLRGTVKPPSSTTATTCSSALSLLGTRRGFLEEVVVEELLVDGDEVVTWFEVRTRLDGVGPFPVVNRMHVGPEGIDRVRVVFDPRPLLG